jgi:F420-non-reducing hydrogenase large subunit
MSVMLEPLRWRDPPARAAVTEDGASPRVQLQVTAPREVEALCVGRPVEELPRILSILSPAHHLCAARLLDRVFGVEPPAHAADVREALRLALVFRRHLRAFWFLASSAEAPLAGFRDDGLRRGPGALRPFLDELAGLVAGAQEAAALLGGRADHPVTAVAGGITRTLRPEHVARLAELASGCRGGAERLADAFRERVIGRGELLGDLRALSAGPLASLALSPAGDAVVVRDPRGVEAQRFAPAALRDHVGVERASWSHEPYAFLKAKGWTGFDPSRTDGLFLVGPLARLAGGEPLPTPLAEAERGRLVGALGPFPRFEVGAAWWALVVEALAAAEGLVALCQPDRLAGPALRTIPSTRGLEGSAALEGPQGLVWQQVRAGADGLVEAIDVLDAATANNALLGVVAQRAVEASVARGQGWDETKRSTEVALLAF